MNVDLAEAVKQVRPFSPALAGLLSVTSRPDHGIGDVMALVQQDPVLTAHLLRAANTAAFRRSEEVVALGMAVSLLGERFTIGLALKLCSGGFFDQSLSGYESAAGELWTHSIKTAIAARLVSRYARGGLDASQAFTAGILHDIGKAVLSAGLGGRGRALAQSVISGEGHESYLTAERAVLGYDHCEAGEALATAWRLPEIYRAAIAHHHDPSACPDAFAPLVFAVHLGDLFAMMTGAGTGADCLLYSLSPDSERYFSYGAEDVQRILLELEDEYAKLVIEEDSHAG